MTTETNKHEYLNLEKGPSLEDIISSFQNKEPVSFVVKEANRIVTGCITELSFQEIYQLITIQSQEKTYSGAYFPKTRLGSVQSI